MDSLHPSTFQVYKSKEVFSKGPLGSLDISSDNKREAVLPSLGSPPKIPVLALRP